MRETALRNKGNGMRVAELQLRCGKIGWGGGGALCLRSPLAQPEAVADAMQACDVMGRHEGGEVGGEVECPAILHKQKLTMLMREKGGRADRICGNHQQIC
jgi:hypothetical protein